MNQAFDFERTDNARTRLILDNNTGNILAYFSVTIKELILQDTQISKTEVKRLDGFNKNVKPQYDSGLLTIYINIRD